MIAVYHYAINDHHQSMHLSLCSGLTVTQCLMYSISYSWGNKESLTIGSIYLYINSGSITTAVLLILPMQNNNQLIKHHLLLMNRRIQYSGWGLMSNTALGFASCFFATQPHPSYCIFCTLLATVL